MGESQFLRHAPCPCGQSSDGLAVFDDGHGHCFVCDETFSAKRMAKEGLTDETLVDDTDDAKPTVKGLLRGSASAIPKRGITEETCKKFGYIRVTFNGREGVHCANIYESQSRKLVAQKLRLPNKDFVWVGDKKAAPGLYGEWLWPEGGKMVVVTEGEIDALTVSQLQNNKWPVVSLMDGAASAAKSIKKSLRWLNTFEKVILMFDNDEPGQKAVEKCVGLFPPGKVFVANLPLKDANDMLMARRGKEVIDAIWKAKEWRPDNILNASELWDTFITDDEAESIPYPWAGLNETTKGLRRGELTTFTAGSGIGKSTVCREVAHWLLTNGQKVGYIALEESVKKTLRELVGLELNKRIAISREGIPEEELADAFRRVAGSGNLYLYDHFGSLSSDRLLDHIRYLAVGCGVSYVVLDHLSIVVSGDDSLGDERRGIDVAMTKLRSLVEETGIGLILVSHLKRPDGKGHEEGAPTTLAQLRGSAAIAQLSDMVIGLERNQQDPENADRTQIRVLKNRFSGDTGVSCGLTYCKETGRLREELGLDEDDDCDGDDGY